VLKTVIPAKQGIFERSLYNPPQALGFGRFRGRRFLFAVVLDPLLRCERSFQEGPPSLYSRLRSELLNTALRKMRYAALGRK